MKILYVSSAKTYGGGERHLVDLCRGMQSRGHEVFVVLRPSNEWQERLNFVPPEHIFHSSIRNSFGVFSAKRIARFVDKNQIDIIHAHVARDYIPASLACRIAKRAKFVLTRHVLFTMKPFHKYVLTNVERAIAVSSAVESNLEKIFPQSKVALISNGFTLVSQTPEATAELRNEFRTLHEIPAEARLIGCVGELKMLKGQRDFVLAANEIGKKFPDAYFVVVGKDNAAGQPFKRELRRLVRVFGLEQRFLFLDWIEDTAPLLAALDIFVSPSHSESFGLAILEAMASAKPIVATETDGTKELIAREESGKIVPIKNPLAIAEAVAMLLRNENSGEKLGANAQKTAVENFGLEKMIEETEKIYFSVLDEKQPDKKI